MRITVMPSDSNESPYYTLVEFDDVPYSIDIRKYFDHEPTKEDLQQLVQTLGRKKATIVNRIVNTEYDLSVDTVDAIFSISGGVGDLTILSPHIRVEFRDYDEGEGHQAGDDNPEELWEDQEGDWCSRYITGGD